MRRIITYIVISLPLLFLSCDKNINVFDKSADQRAAEAKASLKADLTAPSHGWRVKYTPASGSGSFYVLLDFKEDNTVNIKSDLAADAGAYFDETITYRIDNSLGLELIMESYCFFSYLFEIDQSTFPAEFEFLYANKTPDGELVFKSKSDASSNATILLFEQADVNDQSFLGQTIATNLDIMAKDLNDVSSLKLTYTNKDLILYISLDPQKRTISIPTASRKTDTQKTKTLNFEAGYVLRGDSLVFDTRLSGSFFSQNISINGFALGTISDTQINLCAAPIPSHSYTGKTSSGDAFIMETTIVNSSGASFAQNQSMSASVYAITKNDVSMGDSILADLPGAAALQMYYNYPLGNGTKLNGIGYLIINEDNSATFALWEFTPTLVDNNLQLAFKPDVTLFGDPTPDDISKVKKYIQPVAAGGTMYVMLYQSGYKLYNPCTGWSAYLFP